MTKSPSDPYTQMSLRLCESLAYLLVDQGLVSKQQVINAIEDVIDVEREVAETSKPAVVSTTPIVLLQDILNSIRAAPEPENLTWNRSMHIVTTSKPSMS